MDRRVIYLLAAFLLCASTAWGRMGVLVVAGTSAATGGGGNVQTVGTPQFVTSGQSVTVPSGASLAVVGASYYGGTSSIDFSSITLGGVSMSKKASVFGADNAQISVYTLTNPTSGTQTLSYTLSATVTEGEAVYISFYSGVTDTVAGSGGQQLANGSDISITSITSVSGDLVYAVCHQYDYACATGDTMSMTGVTETANSCREAARLYYGFSVASGSSASLECTKSGGSNYIAGMLAVFSAVR